MRTLSGVADRVVLPGVRVSLSKEFPEVRGPRMLYKLGTHTGQREVWGGQEGQVAECGKTRGAKALRGGEGLKGLCCQAELGLHCKGHQGPWG